MALLAPVTCIAAAEDSAALAIEAQVDALITSDAPDIHGARVAWPALIQEFYARRSFHPAWTSARIAQELQRALEDSRLDGLDPEDYHLPLLKQLAGEIASPSATDALRAQFDVLSTDATVRLGYHLSFGKVDPESFDAQWNYARTLESIDVAKEIEAALAAGDIYARIEALKPTHRLYITLKRELARYREAAAAGVWPIVAPGPAIKPGASDPRVAVLRSRLVASGDLEQPTSNSDSKGEDSLLYDAALQAAVRRFQERTGLAADGAIGSRTLEELNVPVADRVQQLRVNLDRGRVLLQDLPREFVVVNIAAYVIYLVHGEDTVWSARVQVGKTYRRTPIFRSQINYLVLNPTWTVPPGIIVNDILPEARRDPSSITRRRLNVLDGNGRKIDPLQVDWSRYTTGIPYTLQQDPGPDNALGRVKFMFPNPYSVYLHDTPSRSLFEAADRSFSSGCVRVERPLELAKLLLNEPDKWNDATIARVLESQRTQNITLKTQVPLLLAYWTAWVDQQGRVNFRRDVYGQDAKWSAGLDREFTIRRRPLVASP
jgi:murein L,D-transpeptidase YcbB/YkuD